MRRSARCWLAVSDVPASSPTTTSEAKISTPESSAKPAKATERAATAATRLTTMPTTFHPSVTYSSRSPRRSSAARVSLTVDIVLRNPKEAAESVESVSATGPVLDELGGARPAYDVAENERRDDHVVGVADDGHEVRYEIDRRDEIGEQQPNRQ